jgi:glucose-1-phosphate cytidylyltransferase
MKTILLAGGLGTRLSEETETRPKPLVEIGGRPILWHIMNLYAHHGFDEFVVALGYKGHLIKDYFLRYFQWRHDLSIDLSNGAVTVHARERENWKVHLVDTGLHTMTGGRLKRLRSWIGDETCMLTYGDGVADIDVRALVEFHRRQGRLATVTAVRPPARFGSLSFRGDMVAEFSEKPQAGEGWVNGGFFVLEPQVFSYLGDDTTVFERDPLERLVQDGQLAAYRHPTFWQCMDTLRDVKLLNDLWNSGRAPWRLW